MLKSVFVAVLALFLCCGGLSFAKAKRASKRSPSSAAKSRAVKSSSSKKSGSKAGASKKSSRTRAGSSGRSKRTASRRSTQQAPTRERYQEIQKALADKGYFQGTVDGAWGPDSIEALKRFQRDQNLTDSGKLDAVSLIALGLGPKRTSSARPTTESRPTDDNRRSEGSERP